MGSTQTLPVNVSAGTIRQFPPISSARPLWHWRALSGAGRPGGSGWWDGTRLPVLVTYTGQVLVDPPKDHITAVFGLAGLPAGTVDVAIVGAGPAGLSAAVYAASEGLPEIGNPPSTWTSPRSLETSMPGV